jgi:hypothetical protein
MDVGHGVNSVLTHFRKYTERIGEYTLLREVQFDSIFSLSFLVWPCLPIHHSCWGLLLDVLAFSDTHTVGRTPLDEGSARGRDLHLKTHNTQKSQTTMPPKGCEPAIPASVRPQTHALDRAATGIGRFDYPQHYQFQWKSRCRTCRFPPVLSNCLGVCLSSRFLQCFMHNHTRRPHLNFIRFSTIRGTIHGGRADKWRGKNYSYHLVYDIGMLYDNKSLINPLAYAAGCETGWAIDAFAVNSSFGSVDGMTCLIPF